LVSSLAGKSEFQLELGAGVLGVAGPQCRSSASRRTREPARVELIIVEREQVSRLARGQPASGAEGPAKRRDMHLQRGTPAARRGPRARALRTADRR
jgi:hypothetical protein